MSRTLGYALVGVAVLSQTGSLVLGKHAALQLTGYTPYDFATNLFYLGSLACLGLQAVVWPLALRALPLFWSYLLMSAVYLVIPVISHFVFHEDVTVWNMVGSIIIMAGIVYLCKEPPKEQER